MPLANPPLHAPPDLPRGLRFAGVAGIAYPGLALPAAGAPQALSGLLRLFVHELYLAPALPLLRDISPGGVAIGLLPVMAAAFLGGALLPRRPARRTR